MYLVTVCERLQLDMFSYKEQLIIIDAIIKRESFIAGYVEPVMTSAHFHREVWSKFKTEERSNPTNVPYILLSKRGENRLSYVEKIEKTHPHLLHSLYRYAVKILGADETVVKLAEAMNERSRELFPECPLRGDLKMSRHHFWNFFYRAGGKLKRHTTRPRLTQE